MKRLRKHSFTLLIIPGMIFWQSCKTSVKPKENLVLYKVEVILNGNDSKKKNLLNSVRGSVGKRGSGSKTIWSRKNDFELGLYISANHVYNLSGWSSRYSQYFNLYTEEMGIFEGCQIPKANGSLGLDDMQSSDFPLMHFDISAEAENTSIFPSEDFYLGVIDNQKVAKGPFPTYPSLVKTDEALEMYDPVGRTKADRTWANPLVGEVVIALGYPQDQTNYPNGAVAFGKVLSDSEAENTIQKLKSAGDSEGDILYNSTAEFFMEAEAIAGMSGGGVFNSNGELLGIMVRASDKENAPKIIRVVKVAYIRTKMIEFYNSLHTNQKGVNQKNVVYPFISGELE